MTIKTHPIDSEKTYSHSSQVERLNKLISDYLKSNPDLDVVSISHSICPYHGEFMGSAIISYKETTPVTKDRN